MAEALQPWIESGTGYRCLDRGLGRALRICRLSSRHRCLFDLGGSGGPFVMLE